MKNQELIERYLSRLRQFDKMLSDEDWKIIENLVEFLKIFRSDTEVLSGATYPTISLIFTARCYASAVLTMGMCPSVCLCPCLSQAGVLLKRQKLGSHKQYHNTPGTLFF